MSQLRLMQIFALAVVVLLIALTPLQWALHAAGAQQRGLAAQSATGTVWRGELKAARFGGVELGDVGLGLDIPGLFVGGGRAWFNAEAPISARGVIALTGSRAGIASLDASLPLEAVMPHAPVRGRLTLKDVDLEFRRGACRSARGQITLGQMSLPGGVPLAPALVLSGEPSCRDGRVAAPLSGLADGVSIDLLISLDAAGRYRLETALRATNPQFATLPALSGFERTMEGFRRVDQGRLDSHAPN